MTSAFAFCAKENSAAVRWKFGGCAMENLSCIVQPTTAIPARTCGFIRKPRWSHMWSDGSYRNRAPGNGKTACSHWRCVHKGIGYDRIYAERERSRVRGGRAVDERHFTSMSGCARRIVWAT